MSKAYSSTTVAAAKSQEHIRVLLKRYAAERMQFHESFAERTVRVTFEIRINGYAFVVNIQARIPQAERQQKSGRGFRELSPRAVEELQDRHERAAWRALFFAIKSRLESVDYGIESFEQAFLAHIVTSKGGKTIGEAIIPQLKSPQFQNGTLLLTTGK